MPLIVEQLAAENIYFLTMQGALVSLENDPAWANFQPNADTAIIMDLREVPTSFDNILQMLKWIKAEMTNGETEITRIPPIFIGSNVLVETFMKRGMPHMYNVERTPVFRTREEALHYVRDLRQARRQES
jgi:hypothetical protein